MSGGAFNYLYCDDTEDFFEKTDDLEEMKEILADETVPAVTALFAQKMNELEVVDFAAVKAIFKAIGKELKVGGKKVFMPLRIVTTGQMHGPDLAKMIPIIGRERILARMARTLDALK